MADSTQEWTDVEQVVADFNRRMTVNNKEMAYATSQPSADGNYISTRIMLYRRLINLGPVTDATPGVGRPSESNSLRRGALMHMLNDLVKQAKNMVSLARQLDGQDGWATVA
ncbi:Uu.00g134850.m01.CDS01 [Anthostomella pinea]|uniref:Uu.00g134850.m01.CDS01 n=1 Tax=Anthostomella pinea TaxID=933095 RepID=A0AAI8VP35_9PEZI|nr:Uu.00g134850.m01.CDS01 [Anthostomella pinea]